MTAMRLSRTLALLAASAALTACSTEAYYTLLQERQKDSCGKLLDMHDRNDCIRQTSKPYDAYKADEEAARGGSRRAPAE